MLVDRHIRRFKPEVYNFNRFAVVVLSAVKKSITRGFQKAYIPTWNAECEELSGNIGTGTQIQKILNRERNERSRLLVQNMEFRLSSRKAGSKKTEWWMW